MRLRHLAPAGSPIGIGDLAACLRTWISTPDPRGALLTALAARVGVRHAFLVCTGRAGMTLLARALRRLGRPDADEVIVPAYTCYSVPASIVRAGLRPRIVDIDPASLDYDRAALEATDVSRVLAIVATNLYGVPNDLPYLVEFGRRKGLFVVDDAAQALGAVSSGRPAGTWGDVGLYSLDKGKNVSAIDGGVIVTNDDRVREALAAEVQSLAEPSVGRRLEHVIKLLVYAVLLRPRLYWIPNAIPQLGLGRTVYTTEFAIEAHDPLLAALGTVMLRRLEFFTAARRDTAERLAAAIGAHPGLSLPTPPPGSRAAWLRLPLFVAVPAWRARLLADLNAAGVGATGSYPASLADVPELQASLAGGIPDVPGARTVASQVLTLPTHPFVSADDVSRIAAIVRGVAGADPVRDPVGAAAS